VVEEAPRHTRNDVLPTGNGPGAMSGDARKALAIRLGGQGFCDPSNIERVPMKKTLIPQTTCFRR